MNVLHQYRNRKNDGNINIIDIYLQKFQTELWTFLIFFNNKGYGTKLDT